MIEELLAAFAEDGPDVGAAEIADILWLAGRVDAAAPSFRAGPSDPGPPGAEDEEAAPAPVRRDRPAPREPEEQLFPAGRTQTEDQEGEGERWGVPLRVGRAASLHEPLALMRSLRPLGRRAIGGFGERLDEQATVERSIEQMLLSPVLLPAESRWLDLALIVDGHHSILLWTDPVDELRQVLTRSGVFRDVRTWYLSGTEDGGTPQVAHRRGGPPRSPSEIIDPSGHRLILVVTDTVADGWRGGPLHDVLSRWSTHNSVAVLNILPERLWTRAAVRPASMWLRADRPASATRSWHRAAAQRTRPRRRRARTSAPGTADVVPMVSASPESLLRLARLTSGDSSWQRMACLSLNPAHTPAPDLEPPTGPRRPSDQAASGGLAAVERFRAGASPTAQQLAAYLAAVPLTLPVMTLVRRSMLPGSEHGHLAEVALGGLFRPWGAAAADTTSDDLAFDFLPGVRDVLLGSQLRSDVATVREVVRQSVWEYMDRHRGSVREFTATRVARSGGGSRRVGAEEQSFAERHGPMEGQRPEPGDAEAPPALVPLPPPDRTGLSGRLVSVTPSGMPDGGTVAGLLLTPRLVLTCLNIWASVDPGPVVRVGDRSVAARVVWNEDRPPGAALVMTEERVLDERTWAERIPERLRWRVRDRPASASAAVRIDAFSEVGERVELGGEARFDGSGAVDVEITEPHLATDWPQLRGAPLSRDGVFTGLIVRSAPEGGRLVGLSARALLDDAGFREVMRRHVSAPYELDLIHAEPDAVVPAATPDWHVSLCAAIEIKKNVGADPVVHPVLLEHHVADGLVELMRAADLDGTVERGGGPREPDLLVTLRAPFARRALGRFLAALSAGLAMPTELFDACVAVAAGEVEDTPQGAVGAAVEAAVRIATGDDFRSRLTRRGTGAEGPLQVAVSPHVRRQIVDLFGPDWAAHFAPFGGGEPGPEDWAWMADPGGLVRAIAETEFGDHSRRPDTGPPWRRCENEASEALPAGCAGRAVEGCRQCLAHLSPQERASYLATLRPGASVDLSGTTINGPLLEEFLAAVRDPGDGHVLLGDAVFRKVVFAGDVDLRQAEFTGEVSFEAATFLGSVDMSGVLFGSVVSLDQAVFEGGARFSGARFRGILSSFLSTFLGTVNFAQCRFDSDVYFESGTFGDMAAWPDVRFGGPVSFAGVTFRGDAGFLRVLFNGDVSIDGATFEKSVYFADARFEGRVSSVTGTFRGSAHFDGCLFAGDVSCDNSEFESAASWMDVRFCGRTSFVRTEFHDYAFFRGSLFEGEVQFDRTDFSNGMDFRGSRFEGVTGFHEIRFDGLADFEESFWVHGVNFTGKLLTSAPASLKMPEGWLDQGGAGTGRWEIKTAGGPASVTEPGVYRSVGLRELVTGAHAVVFDFDTICGLLTGHRAQNIAVGLLHRAAEAGELRAQLSEAPDDPYAVLRALAESPLDTEVMAELETYLTQEELRASETAFPVPYADPLVRTWPVLGVRLAVIAECSQPVVMRYLSSRGLADVFETRIYGRRQDLQYLKLDPVTLEMALHELAVPPADTLLITSDPATVSAGREAGVSTLGWARTEEHADRLRAAGAALVVTSLESVLRTVRELRDNSPAPD